MTERVLETSLPVLRRQETTPHMQLLLPLLEKEGRPWYQTPLVYWRRGEEIMMLPFAFWMDGTDILNVMKEQTRFRIFFADKTESNLSIQIPPIHGGGAGAHHFVRKLYYVHQIAFEGNVGPTKL